MLVTVYIPTHNRVALLKRAILSVIQQTYRPIEIIVVDDGSEHGTVNNVICELLENHSINDELEINLLRHDSSKGACAARNLAISKAKGHYITGLDDDDEFEATHVENLVRMFKPTQFSFVAPSIVEYKGPDEIVERNFDSGLVKLSDLLHYNKVGNQVLTLVSRLRDIGGFDESMPALQDYDTWIRLIERFGPGYKSKVCTYIWHTSHEHTRISHGNENRAIALNLIIKKHGHLMSKSHRQSIQLLMCKINMEKLSIINFLRLINRNNYLVSISLFVNSNFQVLRPVLRWLRKNR